MSTSKKQLQGEENIENLRKSPYKLQISKHSISKIVKSECLFNSLILQPEPNCFGVDAI